MLERVYGRQTPEQLAAAMARAMGLTQRVCSAFVSAPTETADPVDAVDDDASNAARSAASEKANAPQDLHPGGPVRAPVHADHRFRWKAITDSGPCRSLIPAQADHRFRSKPIAERVAM